MCPAAVEEHCTFHSARLSSYNQLRDEIDAYLSIKISSTGSIPMELDALSQNLPKGKGKGKRGKGESAVGSTATSKKQVCHRCGREGHWKSECWSKTNVKGEPLPHRTDSQKGKQQSGKGKKEKGKGRGKKGVHELEQDSGLEGEGATQRETLGLLCMLAPWKTTSTAPWRMTSSSSSSGNWQSREDTQHNASGKDVDNHPPVPDHRRPLPRRKKVDTRKPLERRKVEARETAALTTEEYNNYFLTQELDQETNEIKTNSTAVRMMTHAIGSKYSSELRSEVDEQKKRDLTTRLQQVRELAKNANQKHSTRLRSDLRAGRPRILAFAKDKSRKRAEKHRSQQRAALSGSDLRKKWEAELEDKRTKVEIGDTPLPGVEEHGDNEISSEMAPCEISWKDRSQLHSNYSKKEQEDIAGVSQVFAREWGTPGWLRRRQAKQKERMKEKRRQKRQKAFESNPSGTMRDAEQYLFDLADEKRSWSQYVEFIVDSGASATVITPNAAKHLPLRPLSVKKSYTSASKNSLRPSGFRELPLRFGAETVKGVRAEVLKVHRNLLSVSRLVQNGSRVVFSESESFIETKDGTKLGLESRNGVFVLSGELVEGARSRENKDGFSLSVVLPEEPTRKTKASSGDSPGEAKRVAEGMTGKRASSGDSPGETKRVAGVMTGKRASSGDSPGEAEIITGQRTGRQASSSDLLGEPEGLKGTKSCRQSFSGESLGETIGLKERREVRFDKSIVISPPPGLYPLDQADRVEPEGSGTASSSSAPRDAELGEEFQGESFGEELEETEVVAAKAATIPVKPSPQMVKDHTVAHIPYRSWCPHCVSGRGRLDQHRRIKEHEDDKATVVSMDYMFLATD